MLTHDMVMFVLLLWAIILCPIMLIIGLVIGQRRAMANFAEMVDEIVTGRERIGEA